MKHIKVTTNIKNNKLYISLKNSKYIGKTGSLELVYGVEVKDSRPVNFFSPLEKIPVHFDENMEHVFSLPKNHITYLGEKIDIGYKVKIHIDDTFLKFDTNEKTLLITEKDAINYINEQEIFEKIETTPDTLNYKKELQILSPLGKSIIGLIGLGFLYAFWESILQKDILPFLLNGQSIALGSLGRSTVAFLSISGIFLVIGIVAIIFVKNLGGSKFLDFKYYPGIIANTTNINKLIQATAKVELSNIDFRINLISVERGFYMRDSGSSEVQVAFSNPIKKITVFEKHIEKIYKGEKLENYITGDINIQETQKELLPSIIVKKEDRKYKDKNGAPLGKELNTTSISYGLAQCLEIEIISPDYSDIHAITDILIEHDRFFTTTSNGSLQ